MDNTLAFISEGVNFNPGLSFKRLCRMLDHHLLVEKNHKVLDLEQFYGSTSGFGAI